MLNTQHLRKSFGSLVAVDDVSFAVERGTLVGLLGPNGAGKTTTVSMIAGLVTPDTGDVLVDGARLQRRHRSEEAPDRSGAAGSRALRRAVGARATCASSARSTVCPARRSTGRSPRRSTLVGLPDRVNDRVSTYSGGMKRRLNLAAGLLHDPDILLLDEPTVGVDPQSRNAIFDNLETLKQRGKALLYTTHYMEEVERLADRIVVIDHGKVIAKDTLDGLQSRVAGVGGGKATLESVFLTLTGRSLRD